MLPLLYISYSPRQRSGARQRGYVLLFALKLLAVVSTLVLGVSASLRLDTQLLAREKDLLQENYALQGAVQYAAAQLALTDAVNGLQLDPKDELLRNGQFWRSAPQPYTVTVAKRRIEVQVQEALGLPDANTLTVPEWQRLFLLLGAPTPLAAQTLATRLVEFKQELIRMRGGAGFASLQELLDWPEIPRSMVSTTTVAGAVQGLQHWLVVGTEQKKVDKDLTPLPLFAVLGNATDAQLQQLGQWRRAGPVAPVQFQAWLQGTGLTAATPDNPVWLLRAYPQRSKPVAGSSILLATVGKKNGALQVLDQWTERSLPF